MENTRNAVLAAADSLIDAFSRHDREKYFASFSKDATFIFHNLDRPLRNRAAYEAEWALWETRDGFRVRSCRSTDRNLQLHGAIAIFSHSVETEAEFSGEPVVSQERETIVFERQPDGVWLAVHEHLSRAS
ncbi:nuclear transport factor 2 family protein [Pararhizobium sp. BT-229]|uniref:YybH family protein n=1 Tax=Pararhizobium sp. BT-229 TaxID=2986923 RepID=UPI0021F73135|nr:nuclear transport factor 2 family protein [Pararhizobium sp. BT-229]MCV9961568.1 nuclear transport factor 2 family protein [Pararhizobium sp. BT-229]